MVEVIVLDAGQGDAIVLRWTDDAGQSRFGFIDCNQHGDKTPSLDYLRDLAPRPTEIDFCLLSHPHDDHYSGFPAFLTWCKAHNILIRNFWHTCASVPEHLRAAVRGHNEAARLARLFKMLHAYRQEGLILNYVALQANPDMAKRLNAQASLVVLAPAHEEVSAYNAVRHKPAAGEARRNNPGANLLSSVLKITVPGGFLLLTADAPKSVFYRLDKQHFDWPSDASAKALFLLGQVPHHGSEDNFEEAFWKRRNKKPYTPAFISVGQSNRYNHPSNEVVQKLGEYGYQVWRTGPQQSRSQKSELLDIIAKPPTVRTAPMLSFTF